MILTAAILLSSCGSIAVTTKLPLPEEPIYPTLTQTEVVEFNTLSEGTRVKLIKRDKLKSDHIKELENIIRSTH